MEPTRIVFCCPIAPLKKTIHKSWFHIQYTKNQNIKTSGILQDLLFRFSCIIDPRGELKMEKFLIYVLAGFVGGITRGLVGFVKNKTIEKANHFKPQYFLITILISGIVGGAAGALADTEWQVSFLAGYAGTDFIENLYKIKIGQRILNPKL
ncbi:hypothetical protein FJZ41_02300 [Candidatus Shapirobacteria bacterium]|nr:hypothetical protein [Candidatus Shapirobacteria bacterium]